MKMQRVHVTFERSIDVVLYAPEGITGKEIEQIADDLVFDGLRDWDPPDWQAVVGRLEAVEIPDEELKTNTSVKYGYRFTSCASPKLAAPNALVLSDDRETMVDASDATWWIVEEETP